MPSPWVGVKYQIVWLRGAGVFTAERRARLEQFLGNVAELFLTGRSCARGRETGQKLLCRGKVGLSGFSVEMAGVVSSGHSLLIKVRQNAQ